MKNICRFLFVLSSIFMFANPLPAQWIQTGLPTTVVSALAISGTNLFAGTDEGGFLSTNNGTSWTAASTGLTNTVVTALAISGTNLFAGTDGRSEEHTSELQSQFPLVC